MLLYVKMLLYVAEVAKTFGPPNALVPQRAETLGEFRYQPKPLTSSATSRNSWRVPLRLFTYSWMPEKAIKAMAIKPTVIKVIPRPRKAGGMSL